MQFVMNFLLNFFFGPPLEIFHMILAKNLEIQDFNYKKKCEKLSIKSDQFNPPSEFWKFVKLALLPRVTLRNPVYIYSNRHTKYTFNIQSFICRTSLNGKQIKIIVIVFTTKTRINLNSVQ